MGEVYIILAVGTFLTQLLVNGRGLLWAIMVAAIWPVVLPFWIIYIIVTAIASRR